jgi:lipopolysaccharide biosynthesis glycosyltransferase
VVHSANKKIAIAISLNKKYTNHCLVLLSSILKNASDPRNIVFYIFTKEHENVDRHVISRVVEKYHAKIDFIEILPQRYRDLSQIEYKTVDAYSRIFAPKILLELGHEKIIYCDTDLMVRRDIKALWDTDLGDSTIGAIRDDYYEIAEGFGPLFNSGLMLINTQRWSKRKIEEQVVQEIRHGQTGKMVLADQDDLNRVLAKDWMILNPRWNTMAGDLMSGKVLYNDSYIIHFNGNKYNKPDYLWNEHPAKSEYYRYLRIGRRSFLPIFHIPAWLVHMIRLFISI